METLFNFIDLAPDAITNMQYESQCLLDFCQTMWDTVKTYQVLD